MEPLSGNMMDWNNIGQLTFKSDFDPNNPDTAVTSPCYWQNTPICYYSQTHYTWDLTMWTRDIFTFADPEYNLGSETEERVKPNSPMMMNPVPTSH